jgi:hypothetical protein
VGRPCPTRPSSQAGRTLGYPEIRVTNHPGEVDWPRQPDLEFAEDAENQDQRYAVVAEYVQVLRPPLDWVKPAFDSFAE